MALGPEQTELRLGGGATKLSHPNQLHHGEELGGMKHLAGRWESELRPEEEELGEVRGTRGRRYPVRRKPRHEAAEEGLTLSHTHLTISICICCCVEGGHMLSGGEVQLLHGCSITNEGSSSLQVSFYL